MGHGPHLRGADAVQVARARRLGDTTRRCRGALGVASVHEPDPDDARSWTPTPGEEHVQQDRPLSERRSESHDQTRPGAYPVRTPVGTFAVTRVKPQPAAGKLTKPRGHHSPSSVAITKSKLASSK